MPAPRDTAAPARALLLILSALVAFAAGSLGGCRGGRYDPDLPGSARNWIEGPVRWLVLPEEARRFRRLGSNVQALAFIEDFWRRRDPDPDAAGNPYAQRFFERVQSADVLYGGEGVRGALTDRGRALIVLGPPTVLRYTRRAVPTWRPGESGGRPASERQRVEVWGYVKEDLSPAAVELLTEEGVEVPFELSFVQEARRTRLVDGEEILEVVARSAVRVPEG